MNIPPRSRLRVLLIAGVAVFVALAGAGVVHYTSQPVFCGKCHEMASIHDGWSTGAHAKTPCYDCHVDSGLPAQVLAKANGLRQVYVHFTERVNMEAVTAQVPTQRCVRCHNMGDTGKLSARVITAHLKHREAKLDCLACHMTSGHSREVFVGFGSASCKECHVKKPDRPSNPYLHRTPCTRSSEVEGL